MARGTQEYVWKAPRKEHEPAAVGNAVGGPNNLARVRAHPFVERLAGAASESGKVSRGRPRHSSTKKYQISLTPFPGLDDRGKEGSTLCEMRGARTENRQWTSWSIRPSRIVVLANLTKIPDENLGTFEGYNPPTVLGRVVPPGSYRG